MNTGHESSAPSRSFFTPITEQFSRGLHWFRSVTREDQKEVTLAADLGLLGQHEAHLAREGLEHTREKILGRTKS